MALFVGHLLTDNCSSNLLNKFFILQLSVNIYVDIFMLKLSFLNLAILIRT